MDKAELEPKLAGIMDAVSVCEGLIYAKITGSKVIVGQTLTEMDHAEIAKKVITMMRTKIDAAQKGEIMELTMGLNSGYIVAVRNEKEIVIGILGEDGKTSVALLSRQLRNIMK